MAAGSTSAVPAAVPVYCAALLACPVVLTAGWSLFNVRPDPVESASFLYNTEKAHQTVV